MTKPLLNTTIFAGGNNNVNESYQSPKIFIKVKST